MCIYVNMVRHKFIPPTKTYLDLENKAPFIGRS